MVFQKDGLSLFELEKPDIVCLQESKCSDEKIPEEVKNLKGYKSYFMAGKNSKHLLPFHGSNLTITSVKHILNGQHLVLA